MELWEWVSWIAFVLMWPVIFYAMWGRHLLNHREAKRTFAPLAEELGLKFTAGRAAKQLGKLEGTVEGYQVVIDADQSTKIRIDLKHFVDLHLQTQDSWIERLGNKPPEGQVTLKFDSFKLNWAGAGVGGDGEGVTWGERRGGTWRAAAAAHWITSFRPVRALRSRVAKQVGLCSGM